MLRLLVALLAVTLASPAFADSSAPVICIDPGHGGSQHGAVGPDEQKEKDVALEVAKRLADEVRAKLGAKVILTRESDVEVDLEERVRIANEAKADVFISIHCNSMPTERSRRLANGMETYFLSAEASGEAAKDLAARENAEQRRKAESTDTLSFILDDLARTQAHRDASRLAYTVHQKMTGAVKAHDRGVHQAPFVVLMGAEMPAILVEIGYISHPRESKKLQEKGYQRKIAESLAVGIGDFLELIGKRNGGGEPPAQADVTTSQP